MGENDNDLSSLKISRDKRQSDRPRSKAWQLIAVLIVLAAIVVAWFMVKEKIKPGTSVRVTTVRMITGSTAGAKLVASGYVVAQRKAEVASKGTGRLEYLGFEEGDTVKTGVIIARLDNEDIKANLELARANLLIAEADSLNAGRNFRRQKELLESGSITEAIYEQAETSYRMAVAAVAAAAASRTAAEVDLENTFIRAPFDGTILTKNADVGEMVAPFASSSSSKGSVVTLADMKSLEVEADVSESNIHKVSVGQTCEIVLDAYPEKAYAAYVKKIVPTADRARATVLTKVAFVEKDDRVLPEMSARVNFFADETPATAATASAIVVSKEAITTRDGQKIVFKVTGEYVEVVPVVLGREIGDEVEITSGVQPGDRVVLAPPGKLQTNDKIEISI
ncbi:MAG: efflux RND transporter periplasmic adaptor subunit [candidate division Zixibacteria bacterium]|nr:efflux RND transporter periplasmic adaptor subunit [candidate division Zixibacteria bacterium]